MTIAKCPKCGKDLYACCPEPGCHAPVDVYSRVCGYLRPTSTWNDGKQQEFAERKEYIIFNGDHIDSLK